MINVPNFPLSHGQVELVLWDSLWGDVATDDFKSQIKYLRRIGIPDVKGNGAGTTAYYNFEDVIELALALAIRGQGFNVKDIDVLFSQYRTNFHKLFIKSYRASNQSKVFYLKLGLKYIVSNSKGGFQHTAPELIEKGALDDSIAKSGSWFTGLFSISKMIQDICERAETVPKIKRGRGQNTTSS